MSFFTPDRKSSKNEMEARTAVTKDEDTCDSSELMVM